MMRFCVLRFRGLVGLMQSTTDHRYSLAMIQMAARFSGGSFLLSNPRGEARPAPHRLSCSCHAGAK